MKKIKIQITHWVTGSVLFEFETEENTIKKTLQEAVLRGANLWGANLREANLWGANLWGANLREADLWRANLWGANLREADLWRADLREANLWRANLREANLRGANLWGANHREANLWGANLWGANLREANLRGANLRGANLRGAKFLEPIFISDLYSLKQLSKNINLRFWKYIENGKTPYQSVEYEVGKSYSFKDYNDDEFEDCGEGGNVATMGWCLRDSIGKEKVELLEVEFKVPDIVAIPYWTDGKFRVKRFKVLRKITRKQGVDILKKLTGLK